MSEEDTKTAPGWTPVTPDDQMTLRRQLGRAPREMVAIARRCRWGRPQVVVNAPLSAHRGRTTPFPTTFWLTCPYLVEAVGTLEAEGWIGRMRERAEADPAFGERLREAHRRQARLRLSLADPEALEAVRRERPKEYQVIATTGVGGVRHEEGVKCLHAHLADYLATGPAPGQEKPEESANPVGRETARLLLERGIDLAGERSCAACSGCALAGTQGLRLGAVDVGSQSVRYLIVAAEEAPPPLPDGGKRPPARAAGGYRLSRLAGGLAMTRLGRGVEQAGRLDPGAAAESIAALAAFQKEFERRGVTAVAGAATAAVREAADGGELLVRIFEETGLSIPAVSGETEAALSFLGAARGLGSGPPDGASPPLEEELLIVIDVGGGSTEFVAGSPSGELRARKSVPVGAVRLTERFIGSDPVRDEEMERLLEAAAEAFRESGIPALGEAEAKRVAAVGGTATTLAAVALGLEVYEPDRIHGMELSRNSVAALVRTLAAMPFEERRRTPGLQPERAGTIVGGGLILLGALRAIGATSCIVSEADILHGLVWRMLDGRAN